MGGKKDLKIIRARRTAFLARFIVLRESKRTRAHRLIEQLEWKDDTTVEELAKLFRSIFEKNGDKLDPVDRDIRRSIAHSKRSLKHFIEEYNRRATQNFIDALFDYERSNALLFADEEEQQGTGGWRLPEELRRQKEEQKEGMDPEHDRI